MARIEICPVCNQAFIQGTLHEHTTDGKIVRKPVSKGANQGAAKQTPEGAISMLDIDNPALHPRG